MDSNFKPFAGDRRRGGFKSEYAFITIRRNTVAFSLKAYMMLGEPKAIEVFFDEERKLMAFKSCEKGKEGSFSVYKYINSNALVSSVYLSRKIIEVAGLYEARCRFEAEYDEEDEALIFDLKETMDGKDKVSQLRESEVEVESEP